MTDSPVYPPELSDRLLVTGDRAWLDYSAVEAVLRRLRPRVVIQGGARGADAMSMNVAHSLGIVLEHYPANWSLYGRAAGPIRNGQMLSEGKPTGCVWFHHDLERSKGTKDMVGRAREAGVVTWSWEDVLAV